jgi:hypothetical protein
MNSAIDAAPAQKRSVCSIDDRIDTKGRNIGDGDFEPHIADLACHWIRSGDG